jgi:hypothetical protein
MSTCCESEEIKKDALVKIPPNRHTGEGRYPELFEYAGFRVTHGMTKQGKIDFFRGRQEELPIFFVERWTRGCDPPRPVHPDAPPVVEFISII